MMPPHFESHGKQLLRDGQHWGDMLTAEIAAAVADILNGQVLPDVSNDRADEIAVVVWG